MLRVAAYTGGCFDPSSRFRVRQYLAPLQAEGVQVVDILAHWSRYPPRAHWQRPAWAGARLAEAILHAPGSRRYDLTLFQREMLSTFVTVEPLYAHPRVLDVDDAIWQHRRGAFADRLASLCDAVICGNRYLAEHFRGHCKRIFMLPTAVDARRFEPAPQYDASNLVIGWSGTSGNLRELRAIAPALDVVLRRIPNAMLRVVCDQLPDLQLPPNRVEWVRWSPEVEVRALQDLRVGLMPLADTPWAQGKCAFKMLTYMACGVPVVVSPVGMNREVLAAGNVGLGARNVDEWVDALTMLLADSGRAERMGKAGRQVVEHQFSVDALTPRLAAILKSVAG